MLHSMWNLPGPGLEPMSPALAGRFLTNAPPGKPYTDFYIVKYSSLFSSNKTLMDTSFTLKSLINLSFILAQGISKLSLLIHSSVTEQKAHWARHQEAWVLVLPMPRPSSIILSRPPVCGTYLFYLIQLF